MSENPTCSVFKKTSEMNMCIIHTAETCVVPRVKAKNMKIQQKCKWTLEAESKNEEKGRAGSGFDFLYACLSPPPPPRRRDTQSTGYRFSPGWYCGSVEVK